MKKTYFMLTPYRYYYVVLLVLLLLGFYLFRVTRSYYAFIHNDTFLEATSPENQQELSEDVIRQAKTAIRHDSNNAKYAYALGSSVYRHYANVHPSEVKRREQGFREAKTWLQKASMLDPADPWYYYELGRLSFSRGECPATPDTQSSGDCATERYFLAALKNAPYNLFLRAQLALWHLRHGWETAFPFIQEIVAMAPKYTRIILEYLWPQIQDYTVLKKFLPDTPEIVLEFSKFLYDKHRDYESELEAERALLYPKSGQEECTVNIIRQYRFGKKELELGNDDGTAEWRTYLAEESVRVKKEICLPDNLDEYSTAALKIFMNSGVPGKFTAYIYLNEHLIKRYDQTIKPITEWYEIPFDKSLLQGKSKINIYVRVTGASAGGNYLQIMGDQDTPTNHSVFNIDTTDDLSYDKGTQTGEYMIRLVLRQ